MFESLKNKLVLDTDHSQYIQQIEKDIAKVKKYVNKLEGWDNSVVGCTSGQYQYNKISLMDLSDWASDPFSIIFKPYIVINNEFIQDGIVKRCDYGVLQSLVSWTDEDINDNIGLFKYKKSNVLVYIYNLSYITVTHETRYAISFIIAQNYESIKDFREDYKQEINKLYQKEMNIQKRVICFDGIQYETVEDQKEANWDDLVLIKDIKKDVLGDIKNFFTKDTEKFYKDNRFDYKRGFLFSGPPGNGKTTFISNLISDMKDIKFLIYKEINPRGVSCASIERFFKLASSVAPCIIVLEDLDISFARSDFKQTLLNCMDGVIKLNAVLVIATTNNPENIDPALASRPSRFDRVVEFNDPSEKERYFYLKKRFNNDYGDDEIKILVKKTNELSYAFLKELYISVKIKEKFNSKKPTISEIEELCNKLRIHKKDVVKEMKESHKLGFGSASRDLDSFLDDLR